MRLFVCSVLFCSSIITIHIHYVGLYARSLVVIITTPPICLLGFSDPNTMLGYSLKITTNSRSIIHIGYIVLFLD